MPEFFFVLAIFKHPVYSKEMKTRRRRVEDAMKEKREKCILLGGDFSGRIGE
jgi:hypothetical protein